VHDAPDRHRHRQQTPSRRQWHKRSLGWGKRNQVLHLKRLKCPLIDPHFVLPLDTRDFSFILSDPVGRLYTDIFCLHCRRYTYASAQGGGSGGGPHSRLPCRALGMDEWTNLTRLVRLF
jgi:hypothetical protein